MKQAEFFPPALPRGLIYREDFISGNEEQLLLAEIRELPLREAQYQQFTARRRTVSYGSSYDFTHLESRPAPPIPEFLGWLRQRAAEWVGVRSEDFAQALVSEYQPGTPLDAPAGRGAAQWAPATAAPRCEIAGHSPLLGM